MSNFLKKRLSLFKDKDVRGEMLTNIGLGIFVNALFSITINQITFLVVLDLLFGIILIVEGIILKKDIKCK